MKYVTFLAALVLIISMVTGCGTSSNADGEKPDQQQEQAKESADISSAQSAQKTYPEIPFTLINWMNGVPDRQPQGGVWIYTKEQHPAMFEETLDWDTNDMLLVQLKDPKFIGKSMDITALQVIKPDLIRILVKFEDDGVDGEAARRYAEIKKGAIDPQKAKFIIETADGQKIN